MADNSFSGIVGSMMKGMEGFLSSKTVVGEPTQIGDTTIIPLVDVTFGVGAGASTKDNKNGGGGGMSGKMTPSRQDGMIMKKLIGYTMFWIAVGMVLMLIISDVWIAVIIIAFLLIVGYSLFHCQ